MFCFFILLIIIFIPYIICSVLAVGIIEIINTKAIKSKKHKILIVLTILFCVCMILMNIKKEKPNDLYVKMNEINVEHKLIGLLEEEVIELLGTPNEYNEKDNEFFRYNAGYIGKGLYFFNRAIFFDCYDVYVLEVFFNENNEVTSTTMHIIP